MKAKSWLQCFLLWRGGSARNVNFKQKLRWPFYIINPLIKTKGTCNTPTDAAPQFLEKFTPFILRKIALPNTQIKKTHQTVKEKKLKQPKNKKTKQNKNNTCLIFVTILCVWTVFHCVVATRTSPVILTRIRMSVTQTSEVKNKQNILSHTLREIW